MSNKLQFVLDSSLSSPDHNLQITCVNICKLDGVDIARNLTGSLSLANGQCSPPGRSIIFGVKQMTGLNSRFAIVTEEGIFQM